MNRHKTTTAPAATDLTLGSPDDELLLSVETLKDLTVSLRDADAVKGAATTAARGCACGTW